MNKKEGLSKSRRGSQDAQSGGNLTPSLSTISSLGSKFIDSTKAGVSTLPLNRNKQAALQALSEDVLQSQDVFIRFRSHVGFPTNVDALAYDPRSKLLAVGTRGGMVKVIGSDGVESVVLGCDVSNVADSPASPFLWSGAGSLTLDRPERGANVPRSPSSAQSQYFSLPRTAYLGFLERSILHVTTAGRIRLCRLDGGDVRELSLGGRRAITVRDVTMVGSQYLVVGCDVEGLVEEGNEQMEQVLNCSRVVHVKSGREGDELMVKPYKIFADQDLEASGRLVCLESAVLAEQSRPLLLFVYRDSGALIYDVRAEKVLCCAGVDKSSSLPAAKRVPTCACWVGDASNCFAIGYEDGSVTVWGVSASTIKANPMKLTSSTMEGAVKILDIGVAKGGQCGPVRSVAYLPGGPGTPHEKECLLVLGGQALGQPDMLSLVSLEPAGWSQEDIVTIPWFGDIISYSIMREENKIMILTEGGQLVVHDIGTWEPLPVSLKFQELPPMTCGTFLPSVHTSSPHAPSLRNLRFLSWKHVEDSKWPFSGGRPPANYFITEADYLHGGESGSAAKRYAAHPSATLLFGHRDGKIRVWDATSEVPKHMTTVPLDPKVVADEGRLMPVTCLDACPLSGLMAIGHSGGKVRLYQFSATPQSVRKVCLESSSAMPYDTQIDQSPGWQYVLLYALHEGRRITSVCLSSRERMLAVGDDAGQVSIVDLNGPSIKMEYSIGSGGSAVSALPAAANKAISCIRIAVLETGKCAVFCLCEDGTLEILDCSDAKGEPTSLPRPAGGRSLLSKPLKPKNESSPLHMALLDADGNVLPALSESFELAWADNSSVERPRTVGMTKLSNFSQGRNLGALAKDFDAIENLNDSESDDSDYGDINTDADLWSSVHRPKTSSSLADKEDSYPNDSFYSNFLKRNVTGACSYVFVASSDSLRLYSLDNVLKGERSPLKKVRFKEPEALFCGSFHSISGSGALITTRDTVRCFTLPGLEEVSRTTSQSDGCLVPMGDRGPWAVSLDGHMVLTSFTNEIFRYSSLVRAPLPVGPDKLMDICSPATPKVATTSMPTSTNSKDDKNLSSAMQGFSSILGSVKGAATAASGLVVQSMHEIEKFGDEGSKYVQTMFLASQGGSRDLPSVADIFQKEVTHLDEEISDDRSHALLADDLTGGTPMQTASTLGARTSTPLSSSAQLRTELLGPRNKSSKTPARRTVSSVKRQYASSRTDDARSVVEETRRALAERGEKLGRLEDKAEQLTSEAEDFASMARELEQAFERKRWF